ncbi:YvcK family protein [Candidatus Ozemobacteraceae bacterium]|nr:YvcK family protein [Candidatus Ozemobacteraceae bacterium]
MRFSLRRWFGPSVRTRRWVIFLAGGVAMACISVFLAGLTIMMLTPFHLDTIRSFDPLAIALAALSAFLLGFYWLSLGIRSSFQLLSMRDYETSEKLRALMFRKQPAGPRPQLVALGGGTGLSSLLKGLKELPIDLTAVVTVTDDGGSSGRLRKDLQILPPGDIRNCLVALSGSESLLSRLFQYRFGEAGGEMGGHSFGNLFIAAMTGVLGDFGTAVRAASQILSIRGQVLPVTCENVELIARFEDGEELKGETAISAAGKRIVEMSLKPEEPLPNPEALAAIDRARLIVLGPGSLYTSVIPNLLVPEIAERINRSPARVVYVCNVMSQPGETDNFSAADHVTALLSRTPLRRIDVAVVNSRRAAKPLMERYEKMDQYWVPPTVTRIEDRGIRVVSGDFLQETDMVRHDSRALAEVLAALIAEDPAVSIPA